MKEILEDEQKCTKLAEKLLRYPGATSEQVDALLDAYSERVEAKEELISAGYSNAAAECFLDRKRYPRPPGWHSVFFYPDSYRPRNGYLVLTAIIIVVLRFI